MFRLSLRVPLKRTRRRLSTTIASARSCRIWPKVALAVPVVTTGLYVSNDTTRDSIDHAIDAVARVSVVMVATVRCFHIYRKVLGNDFQGNDEERNHELIRAHKAAAEVTLKALEKNGGIYIKLGQHVSALTYLLPPEWTSTMTPLQDQCPRSSLDDIANMFKKDMGVELEEYFSEFDPTPVGVASLAQVHIATVRNTGKKVAVKVQHPSLARFVPLDVYMTQTVFQLMHKVFPEYPMTWLGDEMQSSIFVELDFRNEALNAETTANQFFHLQGLTALRVPGIVSAEKRILVMEYVAGARLDNLKYMKEHNINTGEVSTCLSHVFSNMIFTANFGLHCDPHLGNLAIRAVNKTTSKNGHNFEIILYDHGLYRYIPLQMKRDYAHFWLAILDNDVPQMRHYAERFCGVKGEQKFRIFVSAITGRDANNALNYDISKPRTATEVSNIKNQLNSSNGVLEDLMSILANMPRIVLLILKTNDLTRNLDESLAHPLGPERTFLILANYCARVVYDEAAEINSQTYSAYSWRRLVANVKTWLSYQKRLGSLYFYDVFMLFRNLATA